MALDDRAFEKLLLANQAKLYDYCRHLTRHKERAEDLQQDANARAWTKRELYKSDDNFLSWIKTVARNYYLNAVKKEALLPIKTVPQFSDADADNVEEFYGHRGNSSAIMKNSTAPNQEDFWLENRIMEAIATLPAHHALLINKKLEGLTYSQIATPLGIKANNAKQRYFNVVKELRELLLQQGLLDD